MSMKIEVAKHERMSQSGSSLLRLIQNTNTSRLDLLVRESIQNSLDAGNKISKSVKVKFNIGKFNTHRISNAFEGIADKLSSIYPGENTYLSIQDSDTVGLTGPLHYDEMEDNIHFGNLLKLVYEISKPQEQDGSGGSWGLGKTVYFRIGIGLVIYYSRIQKADGEYQSRLAAALVEDENKSDALIPNQYKTLQRGIAWWGEAYQGSSQTVPVTDEAEIAGLLQAFGVRPYQGDKTGTTIIIPYIDEQQLLSEAVDTDEDRVKPYWAKAGFSGEYSIEDYLKVAVQRWYAPRLDNEKYSETQKQQYLSFYLNNKKLEYDDMDPIFQLIQDLYNADIGGEAFFKDKKILTQKIELRNVFDGNSLAGKISYARVSKEDLKMTAPDNLPCPYDYINVPNIGGIENCPIILYTRKPGMVVAYGITGDWVEGIPKTTSGEYMIGIFVPESNKKLKARDYTLEEYLRKSEKADHMSWNDISEDGFHPFIVNKIQGHVRDKIQKTYADLPRHEKDHKNLGLGRALAESVLPPVDFSNWDDAKGGTRGTGGSSGSEVGIDSTSETIKNVGHNPLLKIADGPHFGKGSITNGLHIFFGKKETVSVEIMILTENGLMDSKKWEEQMERPYPIKLNKVKITGVRTLNGKRRKVIAQDMLLAEEAGNINLSEHVIAFTMDKSKIYEEKLGFTLTRTDKAIDMLAVEIDYSLKGVRAVLQLNSK